MLSAIFLFELRQRLHRISTYVYFVVFFALGLLFALMSGGAFAQASVDFGTGGKILLNSPYALNGVITYICFFGIVITAAIAGQATSLRAMAFRHIRPFSCATSAAGSPTACTRPW